MMHLPASMLPETSPVATLAKATLLFKQNMSHSYTVVRARDVKVFVAPHAQHARGVYCGFTVRGARRVQAFVEGFQPTLIVVDGWPDVSLAGDCHAPTDAGNGVTVAKGRALSCSPMWGHEARAAAHKAGKVVFDAHDWLDVAQAA
jgi:hypothetical protein